MFNIFFGSVSSSTSGILYLSGTEYSFFIRLKHFVLVKQEQYLLDEQQIHVYGQEQGYEQKGGGAEELVYGFVSDNRKRAGVVEHMMVPMVLPKP